MKPSPPAPEPTKDRRPGGPGFGRLLGWMILRPARAVEALLDDETALGKGLAVQGLLIAGYTYVVAALLFGGAGALNPSVLQLGPFQQYRLQIFYQGPLFLYATLAAAGLLQLLTRRAAPYGRVFAALGFAYSVPCLLTTLPVEAVAGSLVLTGATTREAFAAWIEGPGALFGWAYQLLVVGWTVFLFLLTAVKLARRGGGGLIPGLAAGSAAVLAFALPVGLFIR
ncbi:MAG: hypothetical protein GF399_09000 [Candidatus Coatesbacteria bacterium]|nr:hypothetical protein [Candidatus Coatesbacteria bacterium]